MNIDYKLMLEQDEQLAKFVSECLFNFAKTSKDFEPMIVSIYSFYMSGMTVKQVSEWLSNINRLGSNNND